MRTSSTARTILRIDSSARQEGSVTRRLADTLMQRLGHNRPETQTLHRELADGITFINEAWLAAGFTDKDDRTEPQKQTLALSDELVGELKAADIVVISAPIYNFSVPASLKAWIDLVCRARETFRYSENGPEGLLKNKTAYLVMASGGVPFGSEMDFASGYLKHIMGFIGISDVRLVYAEGINGDAELSEQQALAMIEQWLPAAAAA